VGLLIFLWESQPTDSPNVPVAGATWRIQAKGGKILEKIFQIWSVSSLKVHQLAIL